MWDVQSVLEYIKVNWPANNVILDKLLSLKLVMLLALASASGAIQIQHLTFHRWVDYQINTSLFTPSYIKAGGSVNHLPESVSLLIMRICTYVWWNVWMLIWIEQRSGEMERTNCYWALFNLTRKCVALLSLVGWRRL